MGIDFLGPFNPPDDRYGFKYALVAVDYFSRFTWI